MTVTLSAVDAAPGSGIGTIEYRVNDGPFQRYSTPFTLSTPGTTRITARATDRAGNLDGAPPTTTVMIDMSAPRSTAAISGTQGLAGWYTSPVTVSLAAADNDQGSGVASIEFSLNDGAFQSYTAPIGVSTQGATRITVRATDAAGNVETALSTTVLRIDSCDSCSPNRIILRSGAGVKGGRRPSTRTGAPAEALDADEHRGRMAIESRLTHPHLRVAGVGSV